MADETDTTTTATETPTSATDAPAVEGTVLGGAPVVEAKGADTQAAETATTPAEDSVKGAEGDDALTGAPET